MQKIKENKGLIAKSKSFKNEGGELENKKERRLKFINLTREERKLQETGITLIALIVTIIVLLILARSFHICFNRR